MRTVVIQDKDIYLIGADITSCKCGKGDASVTSYFVQTTRYIRGVMFLGIGYVWKCEQCKTQYTNAENRDYRFCPDCGRKIVEFVDDDESEGES